MLKYEKVNFVKMRDWDNLVIETYKRPYCLQQQEDCMSRGIINITIPSEETNDEEMHDEIPEKVNGDEMGVKFAVWLARDPKQLLKNKEDQDDWSLDLFWSRNFYPDLQTVANDLYSRGLIEAGDYIINIDW